MSEETKTPETKEPPKLDKEGLPEAPDINTFKTGNAQVDGDAFKLAIRDWAAVYEIAHAKLYPASDATRPPPDPGPEPEMPLEPPEPRRREDESREQLGARLAEWLPLQQEWWFRKYLPWEIVRTRWYTSYNTKRDWDALRRLEVRQKAEFRHRAIVAVLRFVITGMVAGGVVLLGLKLWG